MEGREHESRTSHPRKASKLSDCQCQSRNSPAGSIPESSDTEWSERRQMKQCWIKYLQYPKNAPLTFVMYSTIIIQSSQTSYLLHPQKEVWIRRVVVRVMEWQGGGGGGEGGEYGNYTAYTIHMHTVLYKWNIQIGVFLLACRLAELLFFQTMASSEICSKVYELKYALWLKHETPIHGENPVFDTVEKPAKIQTISNRLASSLINRLTSYQEDLSSNPRRDRTQQAITKSWSPLS